MDFIIKQVQTQKQQELLQEIEELEWNCQAKECIKKCEAYLEKFPKCQEVIPSYAHMCHYIDNVKATNMAKKLYDDQPHFYKNTYIYVYLLSHFEKRGRDDIQAIYHHCNSHQDEKDIYFYLTFAITANQLFNYHQNLKLLQQAILTFPNHKMIGRVYHHYAATTGSMFYYEKSIELQQNFDYNYIHLAGKQNTFQKAIVLINKATTINPNNSQGLFKLGMKYIQHENQEEAKRVFNRFLSVKTYNPKWIEQYLSWRYYYERSKPSNQREKISIEIIKNSYIFENTNSSNIQIFEDFINNIDLYSEKKNTRGDIRELLLFYMQQSMNGYLQIAYKSSITQFGQLLINEANLTLQGIILLLIYQKNVMNEISYKPNYIIWDLYID